MLKRDSDKQGLQTFTHHQPLLFCPSAVFTYSLNAWRVSVSAYVSCLQRGISVLAIIIQIPPSMHVREQRRDSIERLTMTTDNDVGCLHRSSLMGVFCSVKVTSATQSVVRFQLGMMTCIQAHRRRHYCHQDELAVGIICQQ